MKRRQVTSTLRRDAPASNFTPKQIVVMRINHLRLVIAISNPSSYAKIIHRVILKMKRQANLCSDFSLDIMGASLSLEIQLANCPKHTLETADSVSPPMCDAKVHEIQQFCLVCRWGCLKSWLQFRLYVYSYRSHPIAYIIWPGIKELVPVLFRQIMALSPQVRVFGEPCQLLNYYIANDSVSITPDAGTEYI